MANIQKINERAKLKKITLISNSNIAAVSVILLFVLLNAFKVALFNYIMIYNQALVVFLYKFGMTLLVLGVSIPFVIVGKLRILFLFFYITQALYILANISYYLYFHSYLHLLQWIALFSEGVTAAGHFSVQWNFKLLIAVIDLPVFIYILLNYKKLTVLKGGYSYIRIVISSVFIAIIVIVEMQNFKTGYSLVKFMDNKYLGESPIVERYGTLINGLVSIYKNKGDSGLVNTFAYGREQTGVKSITNENPSFLILQLESVDSNIINHKHKDRYITPFLHSLTGESIYYPYMLSYHMAGGTSDAEFSIINSIEPLDEYPAMKLLNYYYPNSLLTELSKGSYYTFAVHGNLGNFFNRDVAFPRMGFKDFYDLRMMKLEEKGWGASDGDVFNYSLDKLKTVKQPYLSYIITMTNHGPFTNARNYYNDSYYDDVNVPMVKDYYNSMTYVDKELEKFVTNIRSTYKNTYIFILGDHTAGFISKLCKQSTFKMENKYFEFVPLIIITPDSKVYKENKNTASFLDIAPTILNAAGLSFKIKSDGADLIKQTGMDSEIPFKGSSYSRDLLYEMISK